MVMDEVFDKLRGLQSVLADKISLEEEIQDIPKLLTTQEELLARLKKGFIEKNKEYESAHTTVAELRNNLAQAESMREKAEKNMDTISTQREYEALDKEIRDASEKEQQYRKDLQKEEHLFAELDEQQKKDAALIQQQEEELTAKRAGIEAELTAKRAQLNELMKNEKEITPGLDAEILFKFERIIRSKKGLGIVAIKGGVCSGCHMILPAEFANRVRSGEEIVFCPYCSRILFYEESDAEEHEYFDDETAGSLSDLDDLDVDEDDEYEEEGEDEEGEKSDIDFE